MRVYFKNLTCFVVLVLALSCANRGTPSGGEKDETPPKVVKADPENFSTNFNAEEIRISFNEYITLKDLQKQLIISPPMKNAPIILPASGASKQIRIKILDTLLKNTTYSFNFGNSIVDNNESNPLPYYSYVMSTGNYIDSLKISGHVADALLQAPDDFVSVMLYEVDSTYTDSIVFKEQPRYITNTLENKNSFTLSNLKAGKYQLIALKEEIIDFKYQPKTDKIGFYDSIITLPTDSIPYNIRLFKSVPDFTVLRASQISNQKISFGFEGDYKGTLIELTNPKEAIKKVITKDEKADTLYFWYAPKIITDSLEFKVTNATYSDRFIANIRDKKRDSLKINALTTGTLAFNNVFKLTANTPLVKLDVSKVTLINKDSVDVAFKTIFDTLSNTYSFDFKKSENNNYRLQFLPNALVDLFGETTDTLDFKISTKSERDYGNIRVQIKNGTYPLIVQLTTKEGEVKHEQYATKAEEIDFKFITPSTYYLRVINDKNKNKRYDTGNFLKRLQAEETSYFPEPLEVRAGFDYIQEFILK